MRGWLSSPGTDCPRAQTQDIHGAIREQGSGREEENKQGRSCYLNCSQLVLLEMVHSVARGRAVLKLC